MEWKILKDNLVIYVNKDTEKPQDELERSKAVSKLVRSIIEAEAVLGHPTEATRKLIEAKYNKGSVSYKDIKVGIYKEGRMELLNDGVKLKDRFEKLMLE